MVIMCHTIDLNVIKLDYKVFFPLKDFKMWFINLVKVLRVFESPKCMTTTILYLKGTFQFIANTDSNMMISTMLVDLRKLMGSNYQVKYVIKSQYGKPITYLGSY